MLVEHLYCDMLCAIGGSMCFKGVRSDGQAVWVQVAWRLRLCG